MDSKKKAVLNINNQELSLPIIRGIENEKAIRGNRYFFLGI